MQNFSQLFKITKLFCKLDALSLSSITHILFTTEHRGKNTLLRTFLLIFNLMAAAHKSCDSYVASPFLLQCVNIWELGRSGLLSDDCYPILVWQFFTFLGDRLKYHRHPILNYSISRDSQNFLMIFYTADDEIFQSLHIIHWWILFWNSSTTCCFL